MESATRLAHSLEGKVGRLIQDLLKSPPPLLDSVANPNDDQPPAIPEPTQDKEEIPLLTIVDIHQKGTATMPRYVKANIHDVIYEPDYMGGPSAIIERAPKTVGLRDLESLKVQMEDAEQEDQKDRDHGVENLLMDVTNLWSNPQKSNYGVEKPKVRWIHLPANKASNVLMRKTYCANYIIASSNAGKSLFPGRHKYVLIMYRIFVLDSRTTREDQKWTIMLSSVVSIEAGPSSQLVLGIVT
jgi:hypothetical protein